MSVKAPCSAVKAFLTNVVRGGVLSFLPLPEKRRDRDRREDGDDDDHHQELDEGEARLAPGAVSKPRGHSSSRTPWSRRFSLLSFISPQPSYHGAKILIRISGQRAVANFDGSHTGLLSGRAQRGRLRVPTLPFQQRENTP